MPDRLHKIVTLFEPDGSIQREYKTVSYEGEGAPRDVEIDASERASLYGPAHAVSTALLADAEHRANTAEAERDGAVERAAELEALLAD